MGSSSSKRRQHHRSKHHVQYNHPYLNGYPRTKKQHHHRRSAIADWNAIGSQRNTSAYMVEYLDDDEDFKEIRKIKSSMQKHHKKRGQLYTDDNVNRKKHRKHYKKSQRRNSDTTRKSHHVRNEIHNDKNKHSNRCLRCENDNNHMNDRKSVDNHSGRGKIQEKTNDLKKRNENLQVIPQTMGQPLYVNASTKQMNENVFRGFPESTIIHPFLREAMTQLHDQIDWEKVTSDCEEDALHHRDIELKRKKRRPVPTIHKEPMLNMDNIERLIDKLDLRDYGDSFPKQVSADDELEVFENLLDNMNNENIDFAELHAIVSKPHQLDNFVKENAAKLKRDKASKEIQIRAKSCHKFLHFDLE